MSDGLEEVFFSYSSPFKITDDNHVLMQLGILASSDDQKPSSELVPREMRPLLRGTKVGDVLTTREEIDEMVLSQPTPPDEVSSYQQNLNIAVSSSVSSFSSSSSEPKVVTPPRKNKKKERNGVQIFVFWLLLLVY